MINEEALESIRECYSIPKGYVLRAPLPEQRPYQPGSFEIGISVDALEAGLRFSLHPTIVECLRWWRISPSQMAPNSWRYFIAFLGECRGAGIVPTRTLFFTCFRLCKSQRSYYLTARTSFKVSAKRPIGSSVPEQAATSRSGKRVKIAVRKHKSRHGEGSSRWAAREKEL
ncbi:hypothetical protein BHM03_00061840 [Ensete ventricosum]|nr:hypothetical protein BHM03_00061840 [Ensete ventricosum]